MMKKLTVFVPAFALALTLQHSDNRSECDRDQPEDDGTMHIGKATAVQDNNNQSPASPANTVRLLSIAGMEAAGSLGLTLRQKNDNYM